MQNKSVLAAFRTAALFVLLICTGIALAHEQLENSLSLDERVACQATLENIAWSERLWPESNPTPKPARETIVSDAQIRARVEDQLRMEAALAADYGQRITSAMLQTELNRMAANTRAPDRLKQRFEALGNDALLIAECMARPHLVGKYLRSAYAFDTVQHGDLRQRAEAALRALDDTQALVASGARDETFALVLLDETDAMLTPKVTRDDAPFELELDADAFAAEAARLDAPSALQKRHGIPAPAGPILRETEGGFIHETVLARADNRIDLRSLRWAKQPFEAWWEAQRGRWVLPPDASPLAALTLPGIHGKAVGMSKSASADTWRWEAIPDARFGHTAVWTGSEMIVWGGGFSASPLNTGGRYDPSSDSWTATTTANAPLARGGHTAVWTGGEMIVWGGSYGDGSYLDTGGRYDPSSDSWVTTATTGAPVARYAHTAVWTGSEMIVWGGYAYEWGFFRTGGRYNPDSDSWTVTTIVNAPTARTDHTAVWTGSEMIVWGGQRQGANVTDLGGRYDPSSDSWSITTPINAPTMRSMHTAVWTGNEMVVWGGAAAGDDEPGTGGRYRPSNDSWVTISTTNAPVARSRFIAVWTGSEMIVWGGSDLYSSLNTGGRYDPINNSWTATTITNAPVARNNHTAVWTGSEMIVWGGENWDGVATNVGGRYDPSSNNWTPMITADAPEARSGQASVWTGSEMIIWGGWNGGVLDTGGRYNPSSDSWTAMEATNMPEARNRHTAVWTGSEMIAWGGSGWSAAFNTGGRYNPGSDSWTVTTTINAPTARAWHTAVWIGGEMIVWGGSGGSNTGGRYDPLSDSWTATTTVGAPASRDSHIAVWTGSEMIVWGGYVTNHGHYLDTGGRYNPDSDSWTATALMNAPVARIGHTAVWTGSEMVIWGGVRNSGDYQTNTGGRYDPDGDSWATMTTSNAPTGRRGHVAVWTGSEMIIWGAVGTNSGGRYNPTRNNWTATTIVGAPRGRAAHTAVWTGNEMIVWGGSSGSNGPLLNSMGVYYPGVPILFSDGFEAE